MRPIGSANRRVNFPPRSVRAKVPVNGCEDPRIDGARGNGDEIHRRRIDAI